MTPAQKLDALEQMGFVRRGSDHQPDCPYVLDEGLRCGCVPPEPEWGAPNDVLEHIGETWAHRAARAREPRPIYDCERW